MRLNHWIVVAASLTLLLGCSDEQDAPIDDGRCHAPSGISAAPQTIDGVITLIDSLPRPVTVECFVQSLARPMTVVGSTDFFSAQPAVENAPRIFAVYDKMIMSFLADGDGSRVLEFAEERPKNLSIKAEIRMPIEGEITADEAFEHIRMDQGTVCGGCHHFETPAVDIDYGIAFASEALRPARSETIGVDTLLNEREQCDPELTPRRCAIYEALFYKGGIVDGEFPRPLPSIYD